jgi:hypothetical protein
MRWKGERKEGQRKRAYGRSEPPVYLTTQLYLVGDAVAIRITITPILKNTMKSSEVYAGFRYKAAQRAIKSRVSKIT